MLSRTMEAGPSTVRAPPKPRAPHPSRPAIKRKKLAPPLPPPSAAPARPGVDKNGVPSLPIKTLQGAGARRTDTSRPEYGREVIFVTRKSSLGMLLGRCKGLIMKEGYTRLTLHAMSAAIPQAILLLHALLDVLPYPRGKKGMWYEMRTGSVECVDEVEESTRRKESTHAVGTLDELLEGIGNVEAKSTKRVARVTSSIEIILHVGPATNAPVGKRAAPGEGKARPNKRKRQALAAAEKAQPSTIAGREIIDVDEEMLISGG